MCADRGARDSHQQIAVAEAKPGYRQAGPAAAVRSGTRRLSKAATRVPVSAGTFAALAADLIYCRRGAT